MISDVHVGSCSDARCRLALSQGQKGNQIFSNGNRAISEHAYSGKSLRLFWGSRETVQCAGEFVLDRDDASYIVQGSEKETRRLRNVIMFRLRQVGIPMADNPSRPSRRIVHADLATPYRHVDPAAASAPRDPFEVDPRLV